MRGTFRWWSAITFGLAVAVTSLILLHGRLGVPAPVSQGNYTMAYEVGHQCPATLPLPSWVSQQGATVALWDDGQGYLGPRANQEVVWSNGTWRFQEEGKEVAFFANQEAPSGVPYYTLEKTHLPGHGVFEILSKPSGFWLNAAWSVRGRCFSLSTPTRLGLLSGAVQVIQSATAMPSAQRFTVACRTNRAAVSCVATPSP